MIFYNFVVAYARLDQTIGKPVYLGNNRDKERITLCSRIGRMEAQVTKMDHKMDQTIVLLNILVRQQQQLQQQQQQQQQYQQQFQQHTQQQQQPPASDSTPKSDTENITMSQRAL
ncbi:potassium voltage-gated channel subfamily kqt member 1-like isoform x2 [Plakobranchus ocellatus]|uniref:Potassium voltage-gated channel subfamily kqt member 1-like isoform x2 n=1 Tax=Plakobranchus ocellatus TaxID=259542 RepID=A0AAV4ABR1_9GAST|nr:potassium voltage-gated channel subfamily kqt member 1-like isoform x2 [Plakobranchus ocellatus]